MCCGRSWDEGHGLWACIRVAAKNGARVLVRMRAKVCVRVRDKARVWIRARARVRAKVGVIASFMLWLGLKVDVLQIKVRFSGPHVCDDG